MSECFLVPPLILSYQLAHIWTAHLLKSIWTDLVLLPSLFGALNLWRLLIVHISSSPDLLCKLWVKQIIPIYKILYYLLPLRDTFNWKSSTIQLFRKLIPKFCQHVSRNFWKTHTDYSPVSLHFLKQKFILHFVNTSIPKIIEYKFKYF